jgi:putative acetyltransferase
MTGTSLIRAERPGDAPAIDHLLEQAFGGGGEADLVQEVRASPGAYRGLVAEVEGDIVGHVALSPVTIEGQETAGRWLGLAPLAVRADHRRRGLGAGLVQAALRLAIESGGEVVFVLGDPAYYGRFGFTAAADAGLGCVWPAPPGAFMVRALRAAMPKGGLVRYHPAFDRF